MNDRHTIGPCAECSAPCYGTRCNTCYRKAITRAGVKPPDPRKTRAYRKIRHTVLIEEPDCQLRLVGCTAQSTTVDHIIPVSIRPDLALIRSNLQGACEWCNFSRGPRDINHVRKRDLLRLDGTQQERHKRAMAIVAAVALQDDPLPSTRQTAMTICGNCGELNDRQNSKHCSAACATALDRKACRDRYRKKVGIGTDSPVDHRTMGRRVA